MRVVLLAATRLLRGQPIFEELGYAGADEWHYSDAEIVCEFAGRTCYRSYNRPNPNTADPDSYITNLIKNGHLSVLEHGSMTFGVFGVSRSLTHELVRHRHLSFSQLSQRYAAPDYSPVIPPLFSGDDEVSAEAAKLIRDHYRASLEVYEKLSELARRKTDNKKAVREAARCVLPNCTPTDIIVTGNHRAWREFLLKRLSPHADKEMQLFARQVLNIATVIAPSIYRDICQDLGGGGNAG